MKTNNNSGCLVPLVGGIFTLCGILLLIIGIIYFTKNDSGAGWIVTVIGIGVATFFGLFVYNDFRPINDNTIGKALLIVFALSLCICIFWIKSCNKERENKRHGYHSRRHRAGYYYSIPNYKIHSKTLWLGTLEDDCLY